VVCWTCTRGHGNEVTSIPFCSMQPSYCSFHYTKNYYTKVVYFSRPIIMKHYMKLLYVALVLIPPHKFVHPPCWYHQLYDLEMYNFRVNSNGITYLPNFIQICPVVLKFNGAKIQGQPYMCSYNAGWPCNGSGG
jgi:hypothetical protein